MKKLLSTPNKNTILNKRENDLEKGFPRIQEQGHVGLPLVALA